MSTGVKVVGAPTGNDDASDREGAPSPRRRAEPPDGGRPSPGRRARPPAAPRRGLFVGVSILAVLGLVGTLAFGLLWAGSSGSGQPTAVLGSARSFLVDLTNFDAKSIDADFASITAMATGTFSSQATKFFNSSIRSELEQALADSRGQIRDIYVQSDNGSQASVYAVVDQVYVNNKITTPQSDVLRVVINLQMVGSRWKISDVTVLEGATPASTGSPSGSAGSSVPGQ
ncbi:MAG: hypothetical protein ACLPVF_11070 [Acidimicrobiales bacterium]